MHESGAGSLCCLSARMCEFMATPLSGARRGNSDFSWDAKRRGAFSFAYFALGKQRKVWPTANNLLEPFYVHFFADPKKWLDDISCGAVGSLT